MSRAVLTEVLCKVCSVYFDAFADWAHCAMLLF